MRIRAVRLLDILMRATDGCPETRKRSTFGALASSIRMKVLDVGHRRVLRRGHLQVAP